MSKSPIEHLDPWLESQIKKERAARDKLLTEHNAPAWLMGRPQDTELGEASPAMVYLAQVLASPLGVSPENLPELISLVWEGYAVDARYTLEVPRFFRVVDFCTRVCASLGLESLGIHDAAKLLREAPSIRDESSFYTALHTTLDAAQIIGDARTFEARAKNLEDALRVRSIGLGLVAMRHAQEVIEKDFDPSESIPAMRAVYQGLLVVFAGARSFPGQTETVDRESLWMYRDVVKMDAGPFQSDMERLERRWKRTTKAS